ncbi:MAG: 4-(cytidine 5'-diphospho)-2-C-methyl-D-erythritol kinase [Planctomycetia bacterium]|nr:4-(cytidine 5'-diphospho)-2-C-methyl-D-erythritol kinase [Planctomycetia bacterium]
MNVHRLAASAVVRAPAKLNLFFEVLAKRNDGFHEIETLMVSVSLYDTLVATADPGGQVSLDCRWAAHGRQDVRGRLPPEHENLATRAVELLRRRSGVEYGVKLELIKRIPAAAGLGGGSSDAAAALLAANAVWKLGWGREALANVAVELGSDVPFFLGGGVAVCRGRGERIEPVAGLGSLHFVVVRPPEGLSTAKVYANCRVAPEPRPLAPLVEALRAGDMRRIGRLIHNRLQPAAESLSPWIGRLQWEFARLDCLAAQMSGSGTSYFGICRHARHARRVARCLQARGVGQVFAVSSNN